jgi:hypothetical protein
MSTLNTMKEPSTLSPTMKPLSVLRLRNLLSTFLINFTKHTIYTSNLTSNLWNIKESCECKTSNHNRQTMTCCNWVKFLLIPTKPPAIPCCLSENLPIYCRELEKIPATPLVVLWSKISFLMTKHEKTITKFWSEKNSIMQPISKRSDSKTQSLLISKW